MKTNSTIITLLILLLVLWEGCRNESSDPGKGYEDSSVIINGKLEGGQGQRLVLEEMGAREFVPIDTVECKESGSFEISFSPIETAFYVLRYGTTGYVTLLIEPGEEIVFEGSFENKDTYQIKGSPGSELLLKLSLKHKLILRELAEITRKNMEQVSAPGYTATKMALDLKFDSITQEFYDYSLEFIYENPGSLAILVALYNMYGQGLPVFYPHKDLHVYKFVDSVLMLNYDGFDAVDLLHAQILEAEHAMSEEGQVPDLEKGQIAPDFVSSRTDGSQLALSELKGDYVLLSFWAGWSRLSRDENVTLKRVQNAFGDKNFKILQVSLDDNKEIWTEAIKDDGLDWDHVSDLKRWDTPVADLYYIDKIPFNVLIDPEGRIVDVDLFGERLMDRLETIFTK